MEFPDKDEWISTSTPRTRLHVMGRENFVFYQSTVFWYSSDLGLDEICLQGTRIRHKIYVPLIGPYLFLLEVLLWIRQKPSEVISWNRRQTQHSSDMKAATVDTDKTRTKIFAAFLVLVLCKKGGAPLFNVYVGPTFCNTAHRPLDITFAREFWDGKTRNMIVWSFVKYFCAVFAVIRCHSFSLNPGGKKIRGSAPASQTTSILGRIWLKFLNLAQILKRKYWLQMYIACLLKQISTAEMNLLLV
jgi:hypothetical protein